MKNPNQYPNDNKKRRNKTGFIGKLVIALAAIGVLAGVVYGVLFISSLYSITNEISSIPKSPKKVTQTIPQEDEDTTPAVVQKEIPPPPPAKQPVAPKPIAAAKPAMKIPAQLPGDSEFTDESGDEEEFSEEKPSEIQVIDEEIQQLKSALPNNMMVPSEKSEAEVEAMVAEAKEQEELQQLIDKNTATAAERQRYYDLISKQLEDERELINHCSQVLGNSSQVEAESNKLCTEVARDSAKRLEEIETKLNQLRQKL